MKRKIIVLVQEGCEGCESIKESMPKGIQYVDVDKPKGRKLADQLGVEYVPAIIQVEGEKICILDDDGKTVKCIVKNAK